MFIIHRNRSFYDKLNLDINCLINLGGPTKVLVVRIEKFDPGWWSVLHLLLQQPFGKGGPDEPIRLICKLSNLQAQAQPIQHCLHYHSSSSEEEIKTLKRKFDRYVVPESVKQSMDLVKDNMMETLHARGLLKLKRARVSFPGRDILVHNGIVSPSSDYAEVESQYPGLNHTCFLLRPVQFDGINQLIAATAKPFLEAVISINDVRL
ncbi:hypothetical protein MBANPS3_010704 [Mucor bainieri]